MKRPQFPRRALLNKAAALAVLALPLAAAPALASHTVPVGHVAQKTLHGGGTTRLGGPVSAQARALTNIAPFVDQFRFTPLLPMPTLGHGGRTAARRVLPRAATPLASTSTLLGFDGLTNTDQVFAGTGIYTYSNYTLEPPDQALAVGNGFVLEAVNNALAVYKTDGTLVGGPLTINQFFRQAPEFDRNGSGTYGESFSDPRAYYDPSTKRWFVEEWGQSVDPVTGAYLPSTTIFLGVSKTSNPTGDYLIYAIPATDSTGTPVLPDYTMLGADANGVYLSTNAYSLTTGHFAGVNVYAIPKAALVATTSAANAPGYVEFDDVDSGNVFTLDPAITPPGSGYSKGKNGAEFFLSIYDGASLGAYALVNTASLNTAMPALSFLTQNVPTETYPGPPPARQRTGGRPLGEALGDPKNVLETGGFRVMNTVYADARLYASLDTAVLDANGEEHAGLAYFVLKPGFNAAGQFTASVLTQGYVAVTGEDVMMPAIGVNKNGGKVLVCTLAGKDNYPSAAYVTFNGSATTLHVAKGGVGPADGFSGYPSQGGNGEERWGDYSAAVADEHGDIWMGTEYIPNKPRTTYANWGTYLFKVTP